MIVEVERVDGQELPSSGSRRLRVSWRTPDRSFVQGDRIRLNATIKKVSGLINPGGFDFAAFLHRQGIQGMVSLSSPEQIRLVQSGRHSIWWYPWTRLDEWRLKIREAAIGSLSQPALGLYLGLIIGEQGFITPDIRDPFMATGTVHILSISGSHLGLIVFLSFFLIRETVRRLPTQWLLFLSRRMTPTRIAIVGALVPLSFYTLLAGGEVATIRAFFMASMCLGAVWLGRTQHLINALALAACLIGIYNPQVLWDVSFQLSFVSVWAIAMLLQWHQNGEGDGDHADPNSRWQWVYDWFKGSLLVTAGVTLVTLPLVAFHFNQIAWLGLLANFMVVPIAGLILVPLGLLTACLVLLLDMVAMPFSTLVQAGFTWFESGVRMLASVPGAEWHISSPSIITIALFYGLVLYAARRSSMTGMRMVAIAGVLLCVGWWGWPMNRTGESERLMVTFLDVGQGDAAVLELPDGKTVLIDAGTRYENFDVGRSVIGPFLWDRGINKLDVVIGTHPQLDHVGGLPWIVRNFEIGEYWGNGIERTAKFYQLLRQVLHEQGLQERQAVSGDLILSSGGCQLWVINSSDAMSPTGLALKKNSGTALNNQSVVTKLECGDHSILFAGDIEIDGMRRMRAEGEAIQSAILKVPHHGAKSSLESTWIRQVGAHDAIISVGKNNRFHHPLSEVLQAYKDQEAHIWRTDHHGAISVRAKVPRGPISVQSSRDNLPDPIPLDMFSFTQEGQNLARLWRYVSG